MSKRVWIEISSDDNDDDATAIPAPVVVWVLDELLPEMKTEIVSWVTDKADVLAVIAVNKEFRAIALRLLKERWRAAYAATREKLSHTIDWTQPGALRKATQVLFGRQIVPFENDYWPRRFQLQLSSCLLRNFQRDPDRASPGELLGAEHWARLKNKLIHHLEDTFNAEHRVVWSEADVRLTPLVLACSATLYQHELPVAIWLRLLDTWVATHDALCCVFWLLAWHAKVERFPFVASREGLRIALGYVLLKHILLLNVKAANMKVTHALAIAVDTLLHDYAGLEWIDEIELSPLQSLASVIESLTRLEGYDSIVSPEEVGARKL